MQLRLIESRLVLSTALDGSYISSGLVKTRETQRETPPNLVTFQESFITLWL